MGIYRVILWFINVYNEEIMLYLPGFRCAALLARPHAIIHSCIPLRVGSPVSLFLRLITSSSQWLSRRSHSSGKIVYTRWETLLYEREISDVNLRGLEDDEEKKYNMRRKCRAGKPAVKKRTRQFWSWEGWREWESANSFSLYLWELLFSLGDSCFLARCN